MRGVVVLVVAGLSLFPWRTMRCDGAWIEKSVSEWDRTDVRKILFDSPWVRHFARTTRALQFEVPDEGPSGMELRGYHAKESKEDGSETTEFYVRWVSSRTLRRAMARRTALNKTPAPAGENDSPVLDVLPMHDFEIAVAGTDMSSFDHIRAATLRAKCYLAVNSKSRVSATRVEFARSRDGRTKGVVFHFPRTTATGEPVISTHDEKVWFDAFAGGLEIRVAFSPQKMVDKQGPDL